MRYNPLNKFSIVFLLFWVMIFGSSVLSLNDSYAQIAEGSGSKYVINDSGGQNSGGESLVADEFSGALSYVVPIDIPPGRQGVEPRVLLNYNSQRKNPNSWVGFGWDLNIGQIERVPSGNSTDYVNGESFKIRFAGQTETLAKSRSGVNASSDYGLTHLAGLTVDEYKAKIETGFSIYLHARDLSNSQNPIDYGWTVIDKSGSTYTFGTESQARIQIERCDVGQTDPCNQKTWIESWVLDSISDRNGNNVDVVPHGTNPTPYEIKYGNITVRFNVTAGGGVGHYYPVFRQAFLNQSQNLQRLNNIQILDGLTTIQQYNFSYTEDPSTNVRYLTSVQRTSGDQNGDGVADEILPETYFEYYGQSNMAWDSTGFHLSSNGVTPDENDSGLLTYNNMLIDMNGDGLVDRVTSRYNSNEIYVYYNTGQNFSYIQGKSVWYDPLNNNCAGCVGKLNMYQQSLEGTQIVNMSFKNRQIAFLMDFNGDGLPDRVYSEEIESSIDNQRNFNIHFSNGKTWSHNEVWRDPYVGENPGSTDNIKSFIDMNGDGLVDRVVGDQSNKRFLIYYNTGAGFSVDPTVWNDPLQHMSGSHPGLGKIFSDDGKGITSAIKDFNGDGLPDRWARTMIGEYNATTGQYEGVDYGVVICLNRNGTEWAQPQVYEGGWFVMDGLDVLAILDKATEDDMKGYIADVNQNSRHDWLDINNDGYLDRIIGDENSGRFAVHFYHGTTLWDQANGLSDAVYFDDPARNQFNDWDNSLGYVTAGNPEASQGQNVHTFFRDMDGDGYLDRVIAKSTGDYTVYPLNVNGVQFSGNGFINWHDKVTQPSGLLKAVGYGQEKVLGFEYRSSARTTKWSPGLLGYPLGHRHLPFTMNMIHKVYKTDFTLPSGLTAPEAIRHPGMRWTTYDFFGGHLFVRHAQKLNPTDYSSDALAKDYFKQFNGFHSVEKTIYKAPSETWVPFSSKTVYHQVLGSVTSVTTDDETLFYDSTAFSHLSLSGRPYRNELYVDGVLKTQERSTYTAPWVTPTDTFECTAPCFPKLDQIESTVFEDDPSLSRSQIQMFQYDALGNKTRIEHYDNGTLLLYKTFDYYGANQFTTSLQLRDRVHFEKQFDGRSGDILRQREYIYDSKGNAVGETILADNNSGTYESVSRSFDQFGNMIQITGIDGVTKSITYDFEKMFPISESVTLPTGDILTKQSTFLRLNGEVRASLNEYGVGTETVYDKLGRPVRVFAVDSTGSKKTSKSVTYSELFESIEGVSGIGLFKTETQEFEAEYMGATTPTHISYKDRGGNVLQECHLSPSGQYRLVQYRPRNGGRDLVKTEPWFSADCSFVGTLNAGQALIQTFKDVHGRVVRVEMPTGDVNSPLLNSDMTYSIDAGGLKVKTYLVDGVVQKIEKRNSLDHLIQVVDANGTVADYQYEGLGNLLSVTVDGRVLTSVTYDNMGRKIVSNDADLGVWTYSYDPNGKVSTQTDAVGNETRYYYDGVGRITLKEMINSAGVTEKSIQYIYDSGDGSHDVLAGELFKIEELDASGAVIRTARQGYDPLFRRVTKSTRSVGTLGDFIFDQTFDFKGRPTSVSYPGGENHFYKYTQVGTLQLLCDRVDCDSANGEVLYAVDSLNGYDVYGGLLKESFGNGVTHEFEYFANSHRLKTFTVSNAGSVYSQKSYAYDKFANITEWIDEANKTGAPSFGGVTYDSLHRISSFTETKSGEAFGFSYDSAGNMLSNSKGFGGDAYEYTNARPHAVSALGAKTFVYDANGNMTADGDRVLEYDAENRLKRVTLRNGMIVDYEYDAQGARVAKKISRSDSQNHIVASETHYLGNQIEIKGDDVILHIYANDKKIATKNLGSITDIFGASGASLKDIGIDPDFQLFLLMPWFMLLLTLFLIASFKPVPEFLPVGTRKFALVWARYKSGFQAFVFEYPQQWQFKSVSLVIAFALALNMPFSFAVAGDVGVVPGQISDVSYFYYVHGDHLGSSHLMTEGMRDGGKHSGIFYKRGDLLQRIEYSPFGEETYVLNPNLKMHPSYTGQVYDVETGLYYYKARYYDPRLARFIQPDTMVPDPENIQQFNRYSYVTNNPLKYRDPTGHFNVLGMLGQGLNMIFNAMGNIGSMPTTTSFNMAVVELGRNWTSQDNDGRSGLVDVINNKKGSKLKDFGSFKVTWIGALGYELNVGFNGDQGIGMLLLKHYMGIAPLEEEDIGRLRDVRIHGLFSFGFGFDTSAGFEAGRVEGSVIDDAVNMGGSILSAGLGGGVILSDTEVIGGYGGVAPGLLPVSGTVTFSGNTTGFPSIAGEISIGEIVDLVGHIF